jgi:hypothetical protein
VDAARFDAVARSLVSSASRRAAITALVGIALTLLRPGGHRETADARRRRHKHKKKPLERNEFGCVDVGKACRGEDANCCSGICQGHKPKKGKKDRSKCVAHNTGGCQAEQDSCDGSVDLCGTGGFCYRTTGNASFCGGGGPCTTCTKDADCVAGLGSGAACVVCAYCDSISDGRTCAPAAA